MDFIQVRVRMKVEFVIVGDENSSPQGSQVAAYCLGVEIIVRRHRASHQQRQNTSPSNPLVSSLDNRLATIQDAYNEYDDVIRRR